MTLIITAASTGSSSLPLSASQESTVTRLSSSGREFSRDRSTPRIPAEGSSAKISAGVQSASDVVIRPAIARWPSTPLTSEAGDVLRGEPDAARGDVLLQVGEAAGAGDGE